MSVIEEDRYQIIEPVKCCRCCVHGRSSVEQRRRSQEASQSVRLCVVMQLFDENNFLHIDREPTTTTLIDDRITFGRILLQWITLDYDHQPTTSGCSKCNSNNNNNNRRYNQGSDRSHIHKYKKCVIWSVIKRKSIVGFGIKLRFILSIREEEEEEGVMIWYNSDSI